jgi:hypothetical protein
MLSVTNAPIPTLSSPNIHENPAMESSFKRKLATIQEIAYIFTISMHNSTFKVLGTMCTEIPKKIISKSKIKSKQKVFLSLYVFLDISR